MLDLQLGETLLYISVENLKASSDRSNSGVYVLAIVV
jgi:hypothetical protein